MVHLEHAGQKHPSGVGEASTPQGFVWNAISLAYGRLFQAASTPQGFVWNDSTTRIPSPWGLLQPHKGSSGTRGPVPPRPEPGRFNPTRVRLELAWYVPDGLKGRGALACSVVVSASHYFRAGRCGEARKYLAERPRARRGLSRRWLRFCCWRVRRELSGMCSRLQCPRARRGLSKPATTRPRPTRTPPFVAFATFKPSGRNLRL